MREIKFRAKCTINNEWIYGDLITYNKEYEILDDDGGYLPIDIETLGQFTGLYDKDGIEIYEGDIVDLFYEIDEEPYVIEWDGERARYTINSRTITADFDNYKSNELYVIGNIHDNKELINA